MVAVAPEQKGRESLKKYLERDSGELRINEPHKMVQDLRWGSTMDRSTYRGTVEVLQGHLEETSDVFLFDHIKSEDQRKQIIEQIKEQNGL